MIIKIGDTITDNNGRTGTISSIGIGTTKSDPAGELGLKTDEYDLDLNYLGAITFGDNWCYFHQIRLVNETGVNKEIAKEENWIGF
jgi:hypothetical protein